MTTLLVSKTPTRAASSSVITGCLLGGAVGGAVGDALGLPVEGLTRARQDHLFGEITGQRLVWRRGLCSDDTEHAVAVAQALLASAGEPELFVRVLARQLRGWILLLPAGVGWATLRACLKLLVRVSPNRSGVFSAGVDPAMRAPLLGVCFGADTERLRALVRASSRITHTDPKAEWGALAVAVAAHLSAQDELTDSALLCALEAALPPGDPTTGELLDLVRRAAASAGSEDTPDFAARALNLPRAVSGYVFHSVPVVLHAALRHPRNYRAAVLSVIACGGDTDTTAAIVGGIVGANVGKNGIPGEWRQNLAEWPRTAAWMEQLGERLADTVTMGSPQPLLPVSLPAVALRNLGFLGVVLYHGFRRLLPPY